MTIITTSLKEMYYFLSKHLWENADPDDSDYYEEQFLILKHIAYKDIKKIRAAFADGWTCTIVPNWGDYVKEVRILDNDELFMVVCGKELVF